MEMSSELADPPPPGDGVGAGAGAGQAVELDRSRHGGGVGGALNLGANDAQAADVEDDRAGADQRGRDEPHVYGETAALALPEFPHARECRGSLGNSA